MNKTKSRYIVMAFLFFMGSVAYGETEIAVIDQSKKLPPGAQVFIKKMVKKYHYNAK